MFIVAIVVTASPEVSLGALQPVTGESYGASSVPQNLLSSKEEQPIDAHQNVGKSLWDFAK